MFGKLTSLAAATSIGIGLLIWVMMSFLELHPGVPHRRRPDRRRRASGRFDPRPLRHPQALPQRKQMVLRKRYWLFYFLTFMAGARRQIFIAFSVLLLVQKFHYSVQEVTILFVINNSDQLFPEPPGRQEHHPFRRAQGPVPGIFERHLHFHRLRHHRLEAARGVHLHSGPDLLHLRHRHPHLFPEGGRPPGHRPEHGRRVHHQPPGGRVPAGDRRDALGHRLPHPLLRRRRHGCRFAAGGAEDQN
ncbi:MAG: hypothetical protein MZU91_14945 [Desulfosudis oleivorans]|nr:hypothetical protein [Desulfosudis oleivorans]